MERDLTIETTSVAGSNAALTRTPLAIALLSFVLSVIAGSTDVIGFLGLNGLFTAHITGNLVTLAAHVVVRSPAILSYLLAVPIFMLALLLTQLLAALLRRGNWPTRTPLLIVHCLLLAAFVMTCDSLPPGFDSDSPRALTAAMLGVTAMAVQGALLEISLVSTPPTGVMTTNVVQFMLALGLLLTSDDSATTARARKTLFHVLLVIVGFILGCVAGAAFYAACQLRALWVPTGLAFVSLVLSVFAAERDL
jgi:uncharacterized membrane protein YoaK (UPF0700 family)